MWFITWWYCSLCFLAMSLASCLWYLVAWVEEPIHQKLCRLVGWMSPSQQQAHKHCACTFSLSLSCGCYIELREEFAGMMVHLDAKLVHQRRFSQKYSIHLLRICLEWLFQQKFHQQFHCLVGATLAQPPHLYRPPSGGWHLGLSKHCAATLHIHPSDKSVCDLHYFWPHNHRIEECLEWASRSVDI